VFTNAMMLAICWEETTFMNIWQVGSEGKPGPAKGFGQIGPSALKLVKSKFDLPHSVPELQQLMDDDGWSISLVGRVLHMLHDRMLAESGGTSSRGIKRKVLLEGYAGYTYDHAPWRKAMVDQWYEFEQVLLQGKKSGGYPLRSVAKRALDVGMPPKRKIPDKGEWDRFLTIVTADLPESG